MTDLVSIIMPSFNSQSTILESIESILRQEYKNWELLITDDCSTDSTVDIIKNKIILDSRIKLFRLRNNSGAGYARNNSIKNASGRFIAFLDSDDTWHEKKLSDQIQFMLKNNVALSYTYYKVLGVNGVLSKEIQCPSKINYKQLLKGNVIGCLTAVYDTNILGKQYMPLIRKRQDMALWLNILQQIEFAYCFPKCLAYYRKGHNSLSSNKFKVLKSQWDIYRKHLQLSYIKTVYYFFNYVTNAIRKYYFK